MANADAVQILTSLGMPEKDARKQLENNTLDLSLYDVEEDFTDEIVIAIAEHCPGLTKVYLSQCHAWSHHGATCGVTDDGIIALAENCPGLTKVDLSECDAVTDDGIIALAENCPGLTIIGLPANRHNTDTAIIALWLNCEHLNDIYWGMIEETGITRVGDQLVDEIVKRAQDLDDGTGPRCKGQMN